MLSVGKNIAEEVAGDDDVDSLRVAQELHRRIVDVHVRQLDIGDTHDGAIAVS